MREVMIFLFFFYSVEHKFFQKSSFQVISYHEQLTENRPKLCKVAFLIHSQKCVFIDAGLKGIQ
jgi:hypothetical protein